MVHAPSRKSNRPTPTKDAVMKVVYDPDKDILQIAFLETTVEETAQVSPDLVLDYDEDGNLIGLELKKASQKVDSPYAIAYSVGEANVDKPQPNLKACLES
jgi:uncharacterized protein YuzE